VSLRLLAQGWASFLVPDALVQNRPAQAAQPVGDQADRLRVPEPGPRAAIEELEEGALRFHRGSGRLGEQAPPKLTRHQVQLQNRLEARLEQAHLQLSSLVSDLLGVSAPRGSRRWPTGPPPPGALAALADYRLRAAPTLWARLGDAPGRWESFQHRQAQAGGGPVTVKSGQRQVVHVRVACDKALRYVVDQAAFLSLRSSEWARAYDDAQRARGHSHREAFRALGAKWLKIIFDLWKRQVPDDEPYHLATMARAATPAALEKNRLT
jgi:hypothetical protein